MKNEIYIIQYLRAIAALMVVFVHASEKFDWMKPLIPSDFGNTGVDLFFVISGFIMVYTTHNREISPQKFFVNRVVRIVPLYWFYSILLFLIAFIVPDVMKSTTADIGHLVKSLFFIPHLSPSFESQSWPILVPGWTLNYEMMFYLIFAMTLWFSKNYRIFLLTAVISLAALSGYLFSYDSILANVYTQPIILEFLAGSLLGYFYLQNKLPKSNYIGIATMLIASAIWVYFLNNGSGDRFINFGIPSLLFITGALMLPQGQKVQWLELIGNASYSIYLSHIFTLGAMRFLWNKFGLDMHSFTSPYFSAMIFISIALLLSTIIGLIAYKIVEVRLVNLFKNKKVKSQ